MFLDGQASVKAGKKKGTRHSLRQEKRQVQTQKAWQGNLRVVQAPPARSAAPVHCRDEEARQNPEKAGARFRGSALRQLRQAIAEGEGAPRRQGS